MRSCTWSITRSSFWTLRNVSLIIRFAVSIYSKALRAPTWSFVACPTFSLKCVLRFETRWDSWFSQNATLYRASMDFSKRDSNSSHGFLVNKILVLFLCQWSCSFRLASSYEKELPCVLKVLNAKCNSPALFADFRKMTKIYILVYIGSQPISWFHFGQMRPSDICISLYLKI